MSLIIIAISQIRNKSSDYTVVFKLFLVLQVSDYTYIAMFNLIDCKLLSVTKQLQGLCLIGMAYTILYSVKPPLRAAS